MTRGLSNNNAGNIRISKTKWQGEIQPSKDKDFKQFKSMAYGYRAIIRLLQNYQRIYHCKTIPDFINRWAPNNENNTIAYINSVCKQMQIPNTHIIDTNDKNTMIAFASAISYQENGVKANRSDVEKGWNLLLTK